MTAEDVIVLIEELRKVENPDARSMLHVSFTSDVMFAVIEHFVALENEACTLAVQHLYDEWLGLPSKYRDEHPPPDLDEAMAAIRARGE
ncbi:MAG: hypothetical protein V3S71_06460 [Acidobacteriota bacterium]